MILPASIMNTSGKSFSRLVYLALLVCSLTASWGASAQDKKPSAKDIAPVREYIAKGWDTLTRSMTDCAFVADPKLKAHPVLYLPAGMTVPAAVEKLHTDCDVDIQHLSKPLQHLGEIDANSIQP